jgi:hypothetical protein
MDTVMDTLLALYWAAGNAILFCSFVGAGYEFCPPFLAGNSPRFTRLALHLVKA